MQTLFKSKELLGTPYLLEEGMQKNFRISLVLSVEKKKKSLCDICKLSLFMKKRTVRFLSYKDCCRQYPMWLKPGEQS